MRKERKAWSGHPRGDGGGQGAAPAKENAGPPERWRRLVIYASLVSRSL